MTFETLSEAEWARVDAAWRALEEGELERARAEVEVLRQRRPGHPDVRIVTAALLIEEGESEDALVMLRGAERSADPALLFHLRATAAFDLARFREAAEDGRRVVAMRPEMAESHDVVSRALEHLGDEAASREHAELAAALEPDRYPLPLEIGDDEFDAIVEASVKELPEPVRRQLDELPVVVEPLPSAELLRAEDPPFPPDILGLFVGRDLFARSHLDPPAGPGAIFLFRRNLLRFCHDREELEREIRVTVQHEVGHLLGLDEDDLDRWGLA
jgi:predicted Zn-dependent protease with MMP-like domain